MCCKDEVEATLTDRQLHGELDMYSELLYNVKTLNNKVGATLRQNSDMLELELNWYFHIISWLFCGPSSYSLSALHMQPCNHYSTHQFSQGSSLGMTAPTGYVMPLAVQTTVEWKRQ